MPRVAHGSSTCPEAVAFVVVATEQLDHHGAGDIQSLGHGGVHGRVVVHLFASQPLQDSADTFCWQQEERQQRQGKQGQSPLEDEHGHQRGGQHDDVRDDLAQGAGQRPLGPDDVIVHAADQGTGLGAGEEADGHALDMVEQLHSQIEDQVLADTRAEEAFDERDESTGQGQPHHDQCERVDLAAVARRYGIVDNPTNQ